MAAAIDVAFLAARATVTLIVLLNELAIVSSAWIILPSSRSSDDPMDWSLLTVMTTLVYAISEPVFSALWTAFNRDDAWIAVLNLPPQYSLVAVFVSNGLARVVNSQGSDPDAIDDEASSPPDGSEEETERVQQQQPGIAPREDIVVMFSLILAPLQMAAATNPTVGLLMEELYADPEKYKTPLLLVFTWLAVVSYSAVRFGDFLIYTRRSQLPTKRTPLRNICKAGLPYAVLLFGVKAMVRVLLDRPNPVAVVLELQSPAEPQQWAEEILRWLGKLPWDLPSQLLGYLSFTASAFSVICTVVGGGMLLRGIDQYNTDKRKRLRKEEGESTHLKA